MAISIELSELKKITKRSEDLNQELNQELNNLNQLLSSICSNVRSSELTKANQNLMTTIERLSTSLQTNLPIINTFLNQQVNSYQKTNIDTREQISSLVNSINENIK